MPWKRLSVLAAALVLAGALAADAVAQRRDRDRDDDRRGARAEWVLLGEKSVGFRVDRDVVDISHGEDWYRDRGFRRLHLIAERNDIHLRSIRLVYMNGYFEDLPVDSMIREGQDQPIDLHGERKYLRRIELTYHARPSFDGRAVMKVYGEPSRFAQRRDRDRDDDRRGARAEWVLLGEKAVGFRVDRDAINISHGEDWYRDRGFRQLHLIAERSDIHLMAVRLVYFNGYAEDFTVDRLIREGQNQQIDLRGERKYLRRIELTYHARPSFEGRAIMKVYGVPARFGPGPGGPLPPVGPGSGDGDRGKWVELGCREVAFLGADRDTIRVGKREGRFKAIRLEARGNDVEVLDLKVIYAGGESDDIRVRSLIRQGTRTERLDLRGRERAIRQIDMVYQKRLNFRGTATVCVEGLD